MKKRARAGGDSIRYEQYVSYTSIPVPEEECSTRDADKLYIESVLGRIGASIQAIHLDAVYQELLKQATSERFYKAMGKVNTSPTAITSRTFPSRLLNVQI